MAVPLYYPNYPSFWPNLGKITKIGRLLTMQTIYGWLKTACLKILLWRRMCCVALLLSWRWYNLEPHLDNMNYSLAEYCAVTETPYYDRNERVWVPTFCVVMYACMYCHDKLHISFKRCLRFVCCWNNLKYVFLKWWNHGNILQMLKHWIRYYCFAAL